uniref:Uncharacterized protein n=1 Tax=Physcomitrium patens TaxID=3218 RepID=A0A2K1KUH7_PHYPA|nr:hypothetical protein PHYPA_004427 [Physcomitrium patens]
MQKVKSRSDRLHSLRVTSVERLLIILSKSELWVIEILSRLVQRPSKLFWRIYTLASCVQLFLLSRDYT